jgi:glycosyltransferase involved in cell wall biosynthesis
MLYRSCRESGIVPKRLATLADAGRRRSAPPRILHLHWTDLVLFGATSEADAETRLVAFTETLDAFMAAGGRLVWTVHNVLPHESRFPDLDALVCQAIADRASAVHVMCEGTLAAVADSYTIAADKVTVIPHSSYLGIYPNRVSRSAARAELGFDDNHTVLTVFGGVRRYKGLDVLLDAFERAVAADPGLRLVIAGRPIRFADRASFAARCERHPAIYPRLRSIPASRVQVYLNAADAVLLPHSSGLNTGLVGLAYAFGRPVIAPEIGCIGVQVPPECGITFRAGRSKSLEEAMAASGSLKDPAFAAAAADRARAYPPAAMAKEFAALITRVVASSG